MSNEQVESERLGRGAHELHVTHSERRRQLIEGHHSRVAPALLEAAYVLLAEAGKLSQLLLGEAFPLPDPLDVPPDQLAHIHAPRSADNDPVIYQL